MSVGLVYTGTPRLHLYLYMDLPCFESERVHYLFQGYLNVISEFTILGKLSECDGWPMALYWSVWWYSVLLCQLALTKIYDFVL